MYRFARVSAINRAIWVLLGLLPFTGIFSQNYSYHNYTVDDGLPTNYVYGGLQDSKGYIWFYTEKGISRFDGYEFRNFTVEDGLPTNDVWGLYDDVNGKIWIYCFDDDLYTIQGDSIRLELDYGQSSYKFATGIQTWVDGRVAYRHPQNINLKLVSDKGGVADTIDMSFVNREEIQALLGKNKLSYLIEPHQLGIIDVSLPSAKIIDAKSKTITNLELQGLGGYEAGLLQSPLHYSIIHIEGKNYVAPKTGKLVYQIDFPGRHLRKLDVSRYLKPPFQPWRFFRRGRTAQLQTPSGLLILDSQLQVLDVFPFEFPENITPGNAFVDQENNYWIPTQGQGVFLLPKQSLSTQLLRRSNSTEPVGLCALATSPEGQLYAGGEKGEVYWVNEKQELELVIPAPPRPLNANCRVNSMLFDNDGGLWLSRQSFGLTYHSRVEAPPRFLMELLQKEPADPFGLVKSRETGDILNLLCKNLSWDSRTERLFIGRGQSSVLLDCKPTKPQAQFLFKNRSYASVFLPNGDLIIGDMGQLYRYRADEQSPPAPMLPRSVAPVYAISYLQDGTLLIGTDGEGLYLFRDGALLQVPGTRGLIINHLHLKGTTAWAATNEGVWQFSFEDRLSAGVVDRVFTTDQGLPTIEVQAVAVVDNKLYAATGKGLAQIDFTEAFRDTIPVSFAIEKILINGDPVPLDSAYKLKHYQNEIQVRFNALSYKSLGETRYFYRLLNADQDFLSTTNRTIRYSGLQSGVYTLKIFAQDVENRLSNTQTIVFSIRPPWWKTYGALLFFGIAAGLLLTGAYRWRMNRLHMEAEQESAVDKQFAELELRALQAQMNPHFIFNALSAIQYFIQMNDRQQADLYLSKFAALIRLFLESSKNKYLNLSEELKLIRLYVELEQLRFRNKFSVDIDVSPEINQYTTLVPTMLLQPFVENAINHGLFHRQDENGRLFINIEAGLNHSIVCVLEDNGVGRAEATAIRQQLNGNHRSRGLQITQERLNALQTVEGYKIDIEVTDLTDEEGKACGTRITLNIPEID